MMKYIAILFLFLSHALAFTPPCCSSRFDKCLHLSQRVRTVLRYSDQIPSPFESSTISEENEVEGYAEVLLPRKRGIMGFFYNRFAGFISGLVGFVTQGIAAEDYEYAELPPPYIPAIFGVVLLAGVGILTSSLGDVMDEEASLGLQSGARAKKEIERSRSSYFGKRR